MSDIAVIYASHYGFTETYARWIAEEVAGDLLRPGRSDRRTWTGTVRLSTAEGCMPAASMASD